MRSARTGSLASTALELWARGSQQEVISALKSKGVWFEEIPASEADGSDALLHVRVRRDGLGAARDALRDAGFMEQVRRGRMAILSKEGFSVQLGIGGTR